MVATVLHKIELSFSSWHDASGRSRKWNRLQVTPTSRRPGRTGLTGQWTGAALPQAWLIGPLLMLAHKLIVMCTPPFACAECEVQRERKGFLRLWCWTIARSLPCKASDSSSTA